MSAFRQGDLPLRVGGPCRCGPNTSSMARWAHCAHIAAVGCPSAIAACPIPWALDSQDRKDSTLNFSTFYNALLREGGGGRGSQGRLSVSFLSSSSLARPVEDLLLEDILQGMGHAEGARSKIQRLVSPPSATVHARRRGCPPRGRHFGVSSRMQPSPAGLPELP